ncbi:hypothetical protein HRbin30_03153 [bacterium HR30]|nr:hypothetical protein HRbin30_03153 [bacterium HR30]
MLEVSRCAPGRKNHLAFEVHGESGSVYASPDRQVDTFVLPSATFTMPMISSIVTPPSPLQSPMHRVVGVALLVGVGGAGTGVAVAFGVLVGAGPPAPGASYAPLSQILEPSPLPSRGRVTPFCESLFTGSPAQVALSPASIAGLPGSSGK